VINLPKFKKYIKVAMKGRIISWVKISFTHKKGSPATPNRLKLNKEYYKEK
jgi:hypothetical protein